MTEDEQVALIYLWTRDSRYGVSEDTKTYVRQHLHAINHGGPSSIVYCDPEREAMARALTHEVPIASS